MGIDPDLIVWESRGLHETPIRVVVDRCERLRVRGGSIDSRSCATLINACHAAICKRSEQQQLPGPGAPLLTLSNKI